jgi:hypothetical protein
MRRAQFQQKLLNILVKRKVSGAKSQEKIGCSRRTAILHIFIGLLIVARKKSTIFSLKHGDSVIQGDEDLLKHAT